MHGEGGKAFSKDFSKTPSGATYARGEMMSWVAT